MTHVTADLFLARHADTAWTQLVRPWLCQSQGGLRRSYVVVPTRGQAHALKQRCLEDSVALVGVEFLSVGLARKKWQAGLSAEASEHLKRPAMGRELLVALLRSLVAERLAPLDPLDPLWGLWRSLASDPERALDDFDALLKAGFRCEHFGQQALRDIFSDLVSWVDRLGYALAPVQSELAALDPARAAPDFGRVLMLPGGAEGWGEFFSLAAFARHASDLRVVLPEPEFRTGKSLDEGWVEVWEALLGVAPQVCLPPAELPSCSAVADLWSGREGSSARAGVLVGKTRGDEMILVADRVEELLKAGASSVAVVFPKADPSHTILTRLLTARGVPFADMIEAAGSAPVDVELQRALLKFYEKGFRMEELIELWPLLLALSVTEQSVGQTRAVCERLFDEVQVHRLDACVDLLSASEAPAWAEVARNVRLLLPKWPDRLDFATALSRFSEVCARLSLGNSVEWPALERFAERERGEFPAPVVFKAMGAFLSSRVPAAGAPGKGVFARVTLTTRRRACGASWSHLILVESNAGVWPQRQESSCWLPDEERRALNQAGRFSLGLFTSEDRADVEKAGYLQLARDTTEGIVFTAALSDELDPEGRLAPNAWLERVLLDRGLARDSEGIEGAFERLANAFVRELPVPKAWASVWVSRRDPLAAFDRHFFADPSGATRPERLPARLIERGVKDPVNLWFDAVVGARRVEWRPLVRSYSRSLGQFAHTLLAEVIEGEPAEGIFRVLAPEPQARLRLADSLAALRERSVRNRYWDSFLIDLEGVCGSLLEQVYELRGGGYVAAEASLPKTATVPLGLDRLFPVSGRMDLVLLDQPRWAGAVASIVDFKTGSDDGLSAKRMSSKGASLQLGIYLAAAQSLGIREGRVWMLRPGQRPTSIDTDELIDALAPLSQVARHLETGIYGALTADRNDYVRGTVWPLACAPIKHSILREKFNLTFGAIDAPPDDDDNA